MEKTNMTIPPKHNKIITVSGEVLKTFITLAIYCALMAVTVVGLFWLAMVLGELVHGIIN